MIDCFNFTTSSKSLLSSYAHMSTTVPSIFYPTFKIFSHDAEYVRNKRNSSLIQGKWVWKANGFSTENKTRYGFLASLDQQLQLHYFFHLLLYDLSSLWMEPAISFMLFFLWYTDVLFHCQFTSSSLLSDQCSEGVENRVDQCIQGYQHYQSPSC